MNSYLDNGFFLLILFGIYYITLNGQPPNYSILFGGAFGMIAIGLIIEVYRKRT